MANELDKSLTEMETMEVDARRRKQTVTSFEPYMISPKGRKVQARSRERQKELLTTPPRKQLLLPNLSKDDALIQELKF